MTKERNRQQKMLMASKRAALCVRSYQSLFTRVEEPNLVEKLHSEVEQAKRAVTHIQRHHAGTDGWIALFQKQDVRELTSWKNQIVIRLNPVYERIIKASAMELTKAQEGKLATLSDTEWEQRLAALWEDKAEKRLEKIRDAGRRNLPIQQIRTSRQYTYQLDEIAEDLLLKWGMTDLYFVQNPSFIQGRRTENTVRELRAMFVDLDVFELTSMTVEQVWTQVQKLFGVTVPTPNVASFSGGGIHLVWWIKPVAAFKAKLWHRIENRIVQLFEPYGVDKGVSDVVRVLRPDGSRNRKRGKATKVIYLRDDRYQLLEIGAMVMPNWVAYDQWLSQQNGRADKQYSEPDHSNVVPMRRSDSTKIPQATAIGISKAKRKVVKADLGKNVVVAFTQQAKFRLQDLETLLELGAFTNDRRRRALFLYRVTANCIYNAERALQLTLDFNRRLANPLDEGVIERETRYAEIKHYRFTTDKIIDWLEITNQEQEQLRVLRHSRNNRTRKLDQIPRSEYEARAMQRRQSIAVLQEQGLSQRHIAKILGCSEGEIRRLLKTHGRSNTSMNGNDQGVRRVVPICGGGDAVAVVMRCECERCVRVSGEVRELARWWSSFSLPEGYVLLPLDMSAYSFALGTEPCDPGAMYLLADYTPPDAPLVCFRYVASKFFEVPSDQRTMAYTRDLYLSVFAYRAMFADQQAVV